MLTPRGRGRTRGRRAKGRGGTREGDRDEEEDSEFPSPVVQGGVQGLDLRPAVVSAAAMSMDLRSGGGGASSPDAPESPVSGDAATQKSKPPAAGQAQRGPPATKSRGPGANPGNNEPDKSKRQTDKDKEHRGGGKKQSKRKRREEKQKQRDERKKNRARTETIEQFLGVSEARRMKVQRHLLQGKREGEKPKPWSVPPVPLSLPHRLWLESLTQKVDGRNLLSALLDKKAPVQIVELLLKCLALCDRILHLVLTDKDEGTGETVLAKASRLKRWDVRELLLRHFEIQ